MSMEKGRGQRGGQGIADPLERRESSFWMLFQTVTASFRAEQGRHVLSLPRDPFLKGGLCEPGMHAMKELFIWCINTDG